LLAEDSPINQKLALGVLQHAGQKIVIANNGKEAVQLSAEIDFDLILMDIQMPEMDGHEATKHIRQRERITNKHVPIIAMTAHALTGDRERCLRCGMDDYLSKPVRPRQLLEKIAAVTGKVLLTTTVEEQHNSASTENPSIDWEHALENTGGDVDLLCELLDTYFQERPKLEQDIERAIATNDFELLHRTAHTLKGALRLFGAKQQQEIAFELEKMGSKQEITSATETFQRLVKELSSLDPIFQKFIQNSKS
jgi:two-component system, sensor histidine kinase and response regulator